MNDAELVPRFGKSGVDCLRHSCQIIVACDENVRNPSIFQICAYARIEACRLIFRNPHAQDFFSSLHVDAEYRVDTFLRTRPHKRPTPSERVFSRLTALILLEIHLVQHCANRGECVQCRNPTESLPVLPAYSPALTQGCTSSQFQVDYIANENRENMLIKMEILEPYI